MHPINSKRIHALIVDDEVDACRNIEALLKQYWANSIEILGMANNTEQAEKMMTQVLPDVLFIDIEMPGENAFQFLTRLGNVPFEIIFVTAYDEYALRALKLNALDYILKPISIEELGLAIRKLEDKLAHKRNDHKTLAQFLNQISKKVNNKSIVLRSKFELMIVDFDDISHIEAESSYARFYFKDSEEGFRSMLLSHPLAYYEELMPLDLFCRVHKSFLVNTRHIKKIIKGDNAFVELKNASIIPLSRRRYQILLDFLDENNISINGK